LEKKAEKKIPAIETGGAEKEKDPKGREPRWRPQRRKTFHLSYLRAKGEKKKKEDL